MPVEALCDESLAVRGSRHVRWCEYGTPTGWPVIHLHGSPGSRLEHPPGIQSLARMGLRMIVPDRPGYGGSSPWPGRTLLEVASDVAALADHVGIDQFDVLGYSGGGPHALACAYRLPQRVRRIALVGSLAPFDRTGTAQMGDASRQLWELARTDHAEFARALQQAIDSAGDFYTLLRSGACEPDRTVLDDVEAGTVYQANVQEGVRRGLAGFLEDAACFVEPWPFQAADVTQPVSLWHGVRDLNVPVDMGRWLARQLPHAELTEWPDAGHFEILRRWDEVLQPFAPR